jgi:hypothetical protein
MQIAAQPVHHHQKSITSLMYLQPLTLTDKKDKIHYHTQSTQSTQHTNNLHQIKGMQEIFRSVDITTPHGQWALNTIAEGSRSLHTQSNTFHRMMTISGAKNYTEVTPDHILRYLFSARLALFVLFETKINKNKQKGFCLKQNKIRQTKDSFV